ncbi:hypothetical protein DENIT_60244 [Pseudomonas veronii]|nr:hypothetical protein DENIT_60244 [Pseudomonas veronii]
MNKVIQDWVLLMRKGYNENGFCRVGLLIVNVFQGWQDVAGECLQDL